jgi:hypothetical protein
MIKLATIAVTLAVISVAQAAPIAPVQQPDNLTITVREGCGAGFTMVNGSCVRTAARAAARRGAVQSNR